MSRSRRSDAHGKGNASLFSRVRPVMSPEPDFLDEVSPQSPEPNSSEVTLQETSWTTLGDLFIGARLCVRGRPRICGEIVQIMPKMGRVVVRFDPLHQMGGAGFAAFGQDSL